MLDVVKQAEKAATRILKKEIPGKFVYHDYDHTFRVVGASKMIGAECDLSEHDLNLVTIAAWFHDTGYKNGCAKHEEGSVILVKEFLSGKNLPEEDIKAIEGCIMATQMPQSPTNLMEQVICDADLHHLACTDYSDMSERMHKEVEHMKGQEIDQASWNEMNYQFFKDHNYFTDYGQAKLQPVKEENLKAIKKAQKQKKKEGEYVAKLEEKVAKLESKIAGKPDRGIETMFRTTSKNHLDLSSMADNKANIMISVNTILISVVVTVLIRKLDEYPSLIIPTLLLIFVCLVTIVLSILATRPNVSSGTFASEDVTDKKVNLLFFGNFHGMDLKRYEWAMKEMMQDSEYLYSSLIRDIYFLGKVLGKKYRLLRAAYTTFMIGFVASILAFVIAMLFFSQDMESRSYNFDSDKVNKDSVRVTSPF